MSPIRRRFAVLAVLAAAALPLIPAGSRAGVTGSPHDFSVTGPYATTATKSGLAPSGSCSGCHAVHNAAEGLIWPRYLTQLRSPYHLTMDNSAAHDYVLPPAVQCYDCHDGDKISEETHPLPYVDPSISGTFFDTSHKPQNTLFGFRKDSVGSMTPFAAGPQTGKVVPGYYETDPPGPGSADGVDTSAALNRSGGHYFKQDPVTSGLLSTVFDNGDKLPCRDCHDPHAWDSGGKNQAFIRRTFPNSTIKTRLGTDVRASEVMANAPYPTSPGRDNVASRGICAACHGYSDTSPVAFSDISADYRNVAIAGMNTGVALTVAEHKSTSQVACVTCHPHNSVGAGCSQCHGFPPPPYPPNRALTPPAAYSQRDPHPQHVGRADGQPLNSFSIYNFQCTICHATSAMGSRSLDGIHATGAYNIAYDFSSLGRPNPPDVVSTGGLMCATVYCHSNGGSDNTMGGAGNYFRTVQWGFTPQALKCNACHGPSTPDGVIATGMPSYASGTAGSATANSHAVHVDNNAIECSVCHFNTVEGTYTAGRTIKGSPLVHVNGLREVVFDDNNAKPGSPDDFYHLDNTNQTLNKRCDVSCHGTGKPLLQRPQWGGAVDCFSCHSGTEQIYKPQDNYGAGVTKMPNPVDNNEYLSSGHGRTAGVYPGDNNAPAGFGNFAAKPSDCYYCHSRNAGHMVKNLEDPFRLGYGTDQAGQIGYVQGAFADNTDDLCIRCHGVPNALNPQGAKGTRTQNMQTHAHGLTGTKYTWPNTPWKCVDCHDPHGDGKAGAERWMMIRSGINTPAGGSSDPDAGSDPKSRPKRTTDPNVRPVSLNSIVGYSIVASDNSYANMNATEGPCEVCHTQTTTFSRTLDNVATHATRIGRCTACHPHTAGFGPKACKGCHGGDNGDSGQVSNNAPNITAYWLTSGHGMTTPKNINLQCEDCHDVGYLSGSSHKTDGAAGAGPPPANVNTLTWPGKVDNGANFPTVNTPHLKQSYVPSTTPTEKYQYALAFDTKCGNPATGCHKTRVEHHPVVPPGSTDPKDNVVRFGDKSSRPNPKAVYWYPVYSSYRDSFYESRSPWVITDVTTSAGGSYPDSATVYGVCVSCHDPHGTNSPKNCDGGTTNHMLRGNSQSPGSGPFCNTACHSSGAP